MSNHDARSPSWAEAVEFTCCGLPSIPLRSDVGRSAVRSGDKGATRLPAPPKLSVVGPADSACGFTTDKPWLYDADADADVTAPRPKTAAS